MESELAVLAWDISQGDMEALLDLSGFEYLTQGGTSRWVQTAAKGA